MIDIASVTPRLATQNGWLVSEVCEAAGKRLITLAGKLSVRALPNPIRDQAMILVEAYERGLHTVRVVDAAGRIRWSTSWHHAVGDRLRELLFDADQLSAGVYQIILESPTRRRVEPLSVVR